MIDVAKFKFSAEFQFLQQAGIGKFVVVFFVRINMGVLAEMPQVLRCVECFFESIFRVAVFTPDQ